MIYKTEHPGTKELLEHINSDQALLSVLYDAGMLPEQATSSHHISFILGAAYFHKYLMPLIAESNRPGHRAALHGSDAPAGSTAENQNQGGI
jgi:hypothetical protein